MNQNLQPNEYNRKPILSQKHISRIETAFASVDIPKTGYNDSSTHDLIVQLELAKENLKHKDEEIIDLNQELIDMHDKLIKEEKKLDATLDILLKLKISLVIKDKQIIHKDMVIKKIKSDAAMKKSGKRLQNLFAILMATFTTLVTSFGVNMATANPPDTKGYVLIVFGCFAAINTVYISILTGGSD